MYCYNYFNKNFRIKFNILLMSDENSLESYNLYCHLKSAMSGWGMVQVSPSKQLPVQRGQIREILKRLLKIKSIWTQFPYYKYIIAGNYSFKSQV